MLWQPVCTTCLRLLDRGPFNSVKEPKISIIDSKNITRSATNSYQPLPTTGGGFGLARRGQRRRRYGFVRMRMTFQYAF